MFRSICKINLIEIYLGFGYTDISIFFAYLHVGLCKSFWSASMYIMWNKLTPPSGFSKSLMSYVQ